MTETTLPTIAEVLEQTRRAERAEATYDHLLLSRAYALATDMHEARPGHSLDFWMVAAVKVVLHSETQRRAASREAR